MEVAMDSANHLLALERVLARHRMILEQLRIHFEGLAPNTHASVIADLRVQDTLQFIRSLEARKWALCRQAEMSTFH